MQLLKTCLLTENEDFTKQDFLLQDHCCLACQAETASIYERTKFTTLKNDAI